MILKTLNSYKVQGKLQQASAQELAKGLPLSLPAIRQSLWRMYQGYIRTGSKRYNKYPYCRPVPGKVGNIPYRILAKGRDFIKRKESNYPELTSIWLNEIINYRIQMEESIKYFEELKRKSQNNNPTKQ
jgi:hypothetical protein